MVCDRGEQGVQVGVEPDADIDDRRGEVAGPEPTVDELGRRESDDIDVEPELPPVVGHRGRHGGDGRVARRFRAQELEMVCLRRPWGRPAARLEGASSRQP